MKTILGERGSDDKKVCEIVHFNVFNVCSSVVDAMLKHFLNLK